MVFSSSVFIFVFLPALLAAYKLAGLVRAEAVRVKLQNSILLLASMIFYGWGGVRYLLLALALVAVNWLCGLWLGSSSVAARRKAALFFGVGTDLLVLLIFKYAGFLIANAERLAGALTGNEAFSFHAPLIPLPIGISFFTFQIISYLVDLYYGRISVQRNPLRLALYVLMFPQLIAGPIVRYTAVEAALDHRTVSAEQESRGLRRFMMGFAKKILLANNAGSFADFIFAAENPNFLFAWLGVICYALQIYMDFSAYSDMAIGLGQVFGFEFGENFNYPYISRSVREFWRRWHISLSSWFRDYVYIPLGGSRRGTARTYRNLLIVFFLTGFWHGAAWNFVIWGLYHGFFLILERMGLGRLLEKLPAAAGRLYTLLTVLIGWVFFRAETLPAALRYLGTMFHFSLSGISDPFTLFRITYAFLFFLAAALILSVPIFPALRRRFGGRHPFLENAGCLLLFGISVCFMTGADYNPFIYFRF